MKANQISGMGAWGLAILRAVVGIVFLTHGAQKLFVYGFHGVAGAMGQMGIPLPTLSGAVVTLVEFIGGAALAIGFGTRWAAALLAINMSVAVLAVHLKGGFFLPHGFEYALTLLAANVALALTGPGKAALDNVLRKNPR
jgi:putative oxidoreductase